MAGTSEGARKAHKTNIIKYGPKYYKAIGTRGGAMEVPKGFSMDKELASRAGKRGGAISRNTK